MSRGDPHRPRGLRPRTPLKDARFPAPLSAGAHAFRRRTAAPAPRGKVGPRGEDRARTGSATAVPGPTPFPANRSEFRETRVREPTTPGADACPP
jgi:hypothetical protein